MFFVLRFANAGKQFFHNGAHGAFKRFQCNIAGETVGHYHVYIWRHNVAAFNVANEVDVVHCAQQFKTLLAQRVAFAWLFAN